MRTLKQLASVVLPYFWQKYFWVKSIYKYIPLYKIVHGATHLIQI